MGAEVASSGIFILQSMPIYYHLILKVTKHGYPDFAEGKKSGISGREQCHHLVKCVCEPLRLLISQKGLLKVLKVRFKGYNLSVICYECHSRLSATSD